MELSKNFEHGKAEEAWYQHWLDKKYFHSEPDGREPYTIVIPPPNVTGVLHMGHCLNNTIQDILVRRARMMGKNACWVPGTDHASIATEAKVVRMLRERGISKSSLSRQEFLAYAWEWKEKYGGIILQQLRKLGCSLDWDRTTFTMDPHYYQSVIDVFNDLYKKGFIYRGKRMINWDVSALTALSDEEVIRRQTSQKLYYLRYRVEGTDEYITIATVRPETIMGDTAIAVHPDDDRFKRFHGKKAIIPLVGRAIPVITDEYVTMDFGTGALKVTPAHDMNDNLLGQKHGLEVIDILNDDGTLNELAGMYIGQDRLVARKKIAKDLEEKGALVKTEDYSSEVGYSERTDAVVEPRLSLQWWIDMKKISDPALRAVLDEEIKFYPPKFRNLYRHWMENIKDWCISRQLWWGQRIPAWYDESGNFVVAHDEQEAVEKFHAQGQTSATAANIKQDEDCLDTWFSSWLWPIEVFRGYSEPDNADINYYYPTNTLVTAPEIIFFWVARMIMAGYEYKGAKPFSEVYFTGIVRDKQGRKMSKQLGNSPDLLGLIDQFGADACRFGILIASPAGNDLLWDVSTNEQGSFFNNKIWNALKLVKMWEGRKSAEVSGTTDTGFAVDWFANRLAQARLQMDEQFRDFRLSEALKTVYSLIWDDFCSWYLEWVKPGFEQPISAAVYDKTIGFFEELMQLLHPFMPFITEEIYHQLRKQENDLTISLYPAAGNPDMAILEKGELLKNVITSIRDARNKSQLKPKDTIRLFILPENRESYSGMDEILCKQVNAVEMQFTSEAVGQAINVVVNKDKFYLQTTTALDTTSQREQLQRDLEYQIGFLESVEKKLANERFVSNAKPEIVDIERKKKADAEAKILAIREGLANI
ncbi:MAG: valine--tRNA ligase [Chitinophagaceae bacterium]|nr:MAG: valine--tRNA ligase [Chitinophagaceae bacterium]